MTRKLNHFGINIRASEFYFCLQKTPKHAVKGADFIFITGKFVTPFLRYIYVNMARPHANINSQRVTDFFNTNNKIVSVSSEMMYEVQDEASK